MHRSYSSAFGRKKKVRLGVLLNLVAHKQVDVNILEQKHQRQHRGSESHHFISNVSVIQKNQRRRCFCCSKNAGNTEAKATPLRIIIIIINFRLWHYMFCAAVTYLYKME